MKTIRKEIISILSEHECSLRQISQILRIKEKDVLHHLEHIKKTVSARKNKLIILPATCLECDYIFKDRKKLHKPGRCPRCKKERITEPRYYIK